MLWVVYLRTPSANQLLCIYWVTAWIAPPCTPWPARIAPPFTAWMAPPCTVWIPPPGKCCLFVSRTHCLFVPPLVLWRCCSQLFSFVWLSIVATQLMSKMCTVFFLLFSPLYCDNIICRKVLKRLQQAHTKLYVDILKAIFQILFIMWQLGISVAEIEFCQAGLLVTCEWPLLLISGYFQFPSHQSGLFFPLEKSLVTSEAPQYG